MGHIKVSRYLVAHSSKQNWRSVGKGDQDKPFIRSSLEVQCLWQRLTLQMRTEHTSFIRSPSPNRKQSSSFFFFIHIFDALFCYKLLFYLLKTFTLSIKILSVIFIYSFFKSASQTSDSMFSVFSNFIGGTGINVLFCTTKLSAIYEHEMLKIDIQKRL